MTTLTVRLSEKEAASLQALCDKTGKNRSQLVRDALRTHIQSQMLDAKRAIALLHAQDEGLHANRNAINNAE